MRGARQTRFVDDEAALRTIAAKAVRCPHCGLYGTLNAHGWLWGNAEIGSSRVVRGRRLYCSSRFRRPGCGRTFSVLLSHMLAGFTVTTRTLARLVRGVVAGACRKAAWEQSGGTGLSLRTGYRLWQRLDRAQSALRTQLLGLCPPPYTRSTLPLGGLLAHLDAALGPVDDVFGRFQSRLQVSLLP
ncbi:MAG: hypothetical protein ACRETX_10760 [Steroidobacteraceae bacterium]